ncbi:MAG: hypothetical protein VKO00_06225 [Cyanobacteriota bacterium]|nr:hypothetical protein [Cyanobacteriota bacterium]
MTLQPSWQRPLGLLLIGLALNVSGCAEEPLPEQGIRRDDCLRDLTLASLDERLKQCNAVVAAFPNDPAPLNDRYLLHSLMGNDRSACVDLRQAVKLASATPRSKLDPQLRSDLDIRQRLCNPPVGGTDVSFRGSSKQDSPTTQ